jgi:hypothetical protein
MRDAAAFLKHSFMSVEIDDYSIDDADDKAGLRTTSSFQRLAREVKKA